MTSFKAAKILLGLSCLTITITVTQAQVDFCGGSQLPIIARTNCVVEDDPPQSCLDIYLDLLTTKSSNSYTKKMIKEHQLNCCDETNEKVCLNSSEGNNEGLKDQGQGDQGACPICGEFGGKLTKPDKMISARYFGTYSCGQLYDMGENHDIISYICGPLQDFANEVCGCVDDTDPDPQDEKGEVVVPKDEEEEVVVPKDEEDKKPKDKKNKKQKDSKDKEVPQD